MSDDGFDPRLITADNRERKRIHIAQRIFTAPWKLEERVLEIGDYQCGRVLVEYKADDITNIGHLMDQIKRMTSTGLSCHLFIGQSITRTETLFRDHKIPSTTLYGMLASIAARGVQVWFCDDDVTAFQLMLKIFEKGNDGKDRQADPLKADKPKDIHPVEALYQSLPGCGPDRAEKLRKLYPLPSKFFDVAWAVKENPHSATSLGVSWCKRLMVRAAEIFFDGR